MRVCQYVSACVFSCVCACVRVRVCACTGPYGFCKMGGGGGGGGVGGWGGGGGGRLMTSLCDT